MDELRTTEELIPQPNESNACLCTLPTSPCKNEAMLKTLKKDVKPPPPHEEIPEEPEPLQIEKSPPPTLISDLPPTPSEKPGEECICTPQEGSSPQQLMMKCICVPEDSGTKGSVNLKTDCE